MEEKIKTALLLVLILTAVVVVEYRDTDYQGNCGYYYPYQNKIRIIKECFSTQEQLKELLIHEYLHHLCFVLFRLLDADFSHTRCFTDNYNKGKGFY